MEENFDAQEISTFPPVLEAQTKALLDKLTAGPQINDLSIEKARALLSEGQSGNITKLPVDIEDRIISEKSGSKISIRIVRPKNSKDNLPVILYFHGGGWVLGDQDTHDRLIRELAHGAKAAVVFVNYSRSPEAHYPVAIEEAYTATKWVAEHSKELNVDASRLAVAGDSAGGNMATVVCMLAKERATPRINFQLMFYPVTDDGMNTHSYDQFSRGFFLTEEAMRWFWNHYAPGPASRDSQLVCPVKASLAELSDLPPALIITAECDVLRDEGEIYARKLMQAGVSVTATRYLGTIHDFVMLNALAETPAARAAITQATEHLRKIFAQQSVAASKRG